MNDQLVTDLAAQTVEAGKNPGTGLGLDSATLLSFDVASHRATLRYYDTVLADIPVLSGVDHFTWVAGDELALLTWFPVKGHRRRGFGSYAILGRIIRPGNNRDPILVVDDGAGGVVRIAEGSIRVSGGGDVHLLDGGRILADYDDGSSAVMLGTIDLTGETLNGLYVFLPGSEAAALFAGQRQDGTSNVLIGAVGLDVDFFLTLCGATAVRADLAQIGTKDDAYRFVAQDGSVFIVTDATTGSAANVHMSLTGLISQVTSSIQNKVDVEDAPIDIDALLRLRPRTWRDRAEVEREPETDRWHVGLVAEEVDEAGLPEFVDYDEAGQPQAVTYDRLVVALLEVVKEQQGRLDALDGGVVRSELGARKPRRREGAGVAPTPIPLQT